VLRRPGDWRATVTSVGELKMRAPTGAELAG
jgi:hypothetical protein